MGIVLAGLPRVMCSDDFHSAGGGDGMWVSCCKIQGFVLHSQKVFLCDSVPLCYVFCDFVPDVCVVWVFSPGWWLALVAVSFWLAVVSSVLSWDGRVMLIVDI